MHVIERETSRMRRATRLIRPRAVGTALFWIVLATTAAMAQQGGEPATETVTTRRSRDLNGIDGVIEKVVTHRSRTNDQEQVVIETYLPSIEAGRIALSKRVHRVTTVTADGSQTIEEVTERNRVALSDPMRTTQRSVTTVRRSGADSYVSEQQVFELDVNGRLVFVRKQIEHTSRD
jgi:heme-degrading monooxygenase HmoA